LLLLIKQKNKAKNNWKKHGGFMPTMLPHPFLFSLFVFFNKINNNKKIITKQTIKR
jgi:hypothetical protein